MRSRLEEDIPLNLLFDRINLLIQFLQCIPDCNNSNIRFSNRVIYHPFAFGKYFDHLLSALRPTCISNTVKHNE